MHRSALAIAFPLYLATVCLSASSAWADSDFGDSDIAVLGDSLSSVLDGLRGKRKGDFTVQVLKARILRTDVAPFKVYSEKAFRKAGPEPGASYAVVTHVNCLSKVELKRYQGQKNNWYMFEEDKLVAFDNHIFSWRCVVFDQFSPASLARSDAEHALLEWVEENFPQSVVHVAQLYGRGIAYARYGRVEDAEAMLAAGDAGFNTSPKASLRREGSKTLEVAGDAERARSRDRLETEIANAKTRIEKGQPHFAAASPLALGEPTDAERKALAADAERRDRESKERWEREQDSRLFVEVSGGWLRVEGYRLRQGPREGEQFVSYDEMVRIKAEQAASQE